MSKFWGYFIFIIFILFLLKILHKKRNKSIKLNKNKQNKLEHIAFIMDGNRRWAKRFLLSKKIAYSKGIDSMLEKIKFAHENKISYLTFFCLSEENLKRKKEDLNDFFEVLIKRLKEINIKKLQESDIQIRILGEINLLPEKIKNIIINMEKELNHCNENKKELTISFAIAYGARQEILKACKSIIKDNIELEKINEELFENYLYTKNIPEPDLLIRTGGDIRLSNFLLWQLSYTEFYFSQKLWPAFDNKDLMCAINYYLSIKRNYGK